MPYSTCCGAYTTETDFGLCPDCMDHCDFEEEEEDDDALFDFCPKCKREYDAIDGEYQLCHHCKYDAETSKQF